MQQSIREYLVASGSKLPGAAASAVGEGDAGNYNPPPQASGNGGRCELPDCEVGLRLPA